MENSSFDAIPHRIQANSIASGTTENKMVKSLPVSGPGNKKLRTYKSIPTS
jgi:hypothetical protein